MKARLAQGKAFDASYIFSGFHGSGKTTLARIMARAMICQDLDKASPNPCNQCESCRAFLAGDPGPYCEMDAASNGTVDTLRTLVDELPFTLYDAPKRIFFFDEAHRMSLAGQDVLLKPVEDGALVAMLGTTEPEKIRGPIRSRCEEYLIQKVPRETLYAKMVSILQAEGVPYEEDAVYTVIDVAGGHIRDIIKRLEMIAQTGSVSVQATRDYLNLGVVSTYYDILLNLGDPGVSLPLLDRACERVPAEAVAAGLAEAAMASYRLANRMFAECAYLDRASAAKVHGLYGAQTVRLAEFFLARHAVSKVTLMCDLVALSAGVPEPKAAGSSGPPIQVVAAPAPVAPAPEPATPAPAPEMAPRSDNLSAVSATPPVAPLVLPPVSTTPAPAPVSKPAPAPAPKPTVPKAVGPHVRPDGIGPLGQDPLALTVEDAQGVPETFPRGTKTVGVKPNFGRPAEDTAEMTEQEFARQFAARWHQLRGGALWDNGSSWS